MELDERLINGRLIEELRPSVLHLIKLDIVRDEPCVNINNTRSAFLLVFKLYFTLIEGITRITHLRGRPLKSEVLFCHWCQRFPSMICWRTVILQLSCHVGLSISKFVTQLSVPCKFLLLTFVVNLPTPTNKTSRILKRHIFLNSS